MSLGSGGSESGSSSDSSSGSSTDDEEDMEQEETAPVRTLRNRKLEVVETPKKEPMKEEVKEENPKPKRPIDEVRPGAICRACQVKNEKRKNWKQQTNFVYTFDDEERR